MSGETIESKLKKAYGILESGDAAEARQVLSEALEIDLESREAAFAFWCCSFWADFLERARASQPKSAQESKKIGEEIVSQWGIFSETLEEDGRAGSIVQRAVYSTQTAVFTNALSFFTLAQKFLDEEAEGGDDGERRQKSRDESLRHAEVQHFLGLCEKELGNYDSALYHLKAANDLKPSDPRILAEMADAFALCGEAKNAKVLFREAFFIDAQKIDLLFLNSELIRGLVERVRERGYSGNELLEWIPVYGILYGVFNIKRLLRADEVTQISNDVRTLMNETKVPGNDKRTLVPRLINMNFWLIDNYARSEEANANDRIRECELSIMLLDEEVYRLYKK